MVAENLANGAGPSSFDWPVPNNLGIFKYDASFPYDNTGPVPPHVVEDLDPVIIINPSFALPNPIVKYLLAFTGGAMAGALTMRFF